MRIAAHHRECGDHVEIRHGSDFGGLFDKPFDRVDASASAWTNRHEQKGSVLTSVAILAERWAHEGLA